MIETTMRLLILLTVAAAPTSVRGAEPLPPRALARLGDHRFYHGPELICAVLSPDGRRAASAAHDPEPGPSSDKERNAYNRRIVLWNAASGERLRELRVPHAPVSYLAFSPDSERLAAVYMTSDDKHCIAVFEIETLKLLRQLGDFTNDVRYLQFSADGKQLRVSEEEGPVSAWDAATGKQLHLWNPPPKVPPRKEEEGRCAMQGVLSPDGGFLVWEMRRFAKGHVPQHGDGFRVHDTATNKLLYQTKAKLNRGTQSFAFSADGKRFAADCDKLTVWETATGKELAAFEIPGMEEFALTPDGRRAVIYEDYARIRLWDLQSGKPLSEISPGFIALNGNLPRTPQLFSADGKTLLAASDSTLRLFDTTTGKERGAPAHRDAVTPRFSADGRKLFTCCGERRGRWDVTSITKPVRLSHEPRNAWELNFLGLSVKDRLFLDCPQDRIRVRETATGRVLCQLEEGGRPLIRNQSMPASPDAARVLVCEASERDPDIDPGLFRLCDTKTGKTLGVIEAKDAVDDPVFSPNGRLLAWGDKHGTVHLHDGATGKRVRTLKSSALPIPTVPRNIDLLFSPDSAYLIAAQTKLPIRVFHVSNGREVARLYANSKTMNRTGRLSRMASSPDGRLLAVEGQSGIVRLLEIASGKVRIEFAGHRHGVHGLAFAPDGKTLASGGEDNVVFLWDVTGTRTSAAADKLSDNGLSSLWNDLASEDGKRAGIAIAALLRKPEASVAFLQERLHPEETTSEKRLAQLLADLDDDAFAKRETASHELIRLGERAEPALRRELSNRPSLEMRRRIEDVLSKLEPSPPSLEMLRALRAIEVLEHIGTPEARRCLEALAKGAAEARQTREAKRTLQRLANRRE